MASLANKAPKHWSKRNRRQSPTISFIRQFPEAENGRMLISEVVAKYGRCDVVIERDVDLHPKAATPPEGRRAKYGGSCSGQDSKCRRVYHTFSTLRSDGSLFCFDSMHVCDIYIHMCRFH